MIFLWGSIQTWLHHKVKLTESERSRLNEVSHRGKPSVRTVKRALALLKADEGLRENPGCFWSDAATVARVRKLRRGRT